MMDVRMPDGTIVKNVPDGITQEDLLERYTAFKSKPAEDDAVSKVAKNPLTRFAVGAGKGLAGTGQFLTNAMFQGMSPDLNNAINRNVWNPLMQQIKRTEQIGNPEGNFNAAGFAGEVLNPVALGAAKVIGPVQGAIPRIAQGSAFGTVMGATQPVMEGDYQSQKMVQLGVGGATGAAIPVVGEVVKFFGRPVLEVFKYMTPGGADKLSKKWVNQIVGPENLKAIVADIEKQLPSIGKGNVPGYRPTTGEMISHIPEASPLLALQNRASSLPGGLSGQYGRRALENREAISQALRPIAGTPESLAAASALAKQRAAANYGPLMSKEVNLASDVALLGEDIARAQGVPWSAPGRQAFSGATNQVPYTGKAGALQQAGMLQTEAARQASLANKWTPVSGMPRVAGRYSENIERVGPALAGANEATGMAARQGQKADFLERLLDVFKEKGILTTESAAPLMQRPSMQNAIKYAENLAKERGYKFPQSLDDNFSVQNLHDIKLGLDAQIRAGAMKGQPSSLDSSTLEAVSGTKAQFIKWLETKVPAYGKARIEFAKDMTPVNRMQVGQALEKKLVSPTDQMTPGTYLRAIDDETKLVKTITGQPRSDLGGIFNPRERATVNEIGGLLERQLAVKNPPVRTNLQSSSSGDSVTIDLPALLSRPVVLANYIIKHLTGGASSLERRIDEINALRMLDPEKFVAALKTMPPSRASQIEAMLQQQGWSPMNTGLINPAVTGLLGQGQ